jgi:hypothetical protein
MAVAGRVDAGWTHVFRTLPRRAPFVTFYLVASWALFVPAARFRDGKVNIDKERIEGFLYHIPHLSEDFPRALRSLATAPLFNHNLVQIGYVTALLLLFGVAVETRYGPARTAALFFGANFVAALAAGSLLHLLYPELWDAEVATIAWARWWAGGSAGCFGLMGAFAAGARRPWRVLGLFLLWELNAAIWYLQNYTSAFHLIALATGFLAARAASSRRHPAEPTTAAGLAG